MATAYQPNDSILTSSSQQRRRLRLGEVLVSEGIATEADISSALAEQKRRPGKRLGEVLVQLGIVGEVVIGQTLARKIGLRFVDLNALEIQSSAQSEIPKKVIVEYAVLPIRADAVSITVAMGDPLSTDALDALRFSTSKRIEEVVAAPSQIRQFIDQSGLSGAGQGEGLSSTATDEDLGDLTKLSQSSDVIKLVNRIVLDGYRLGASDIHIEPNGPKEDVVVRFRVDGQCQIYRHMPSIFRNSLVARLKVMGRLNIAERRKPQDGKIPFRIGSRNIELRMATLPTAGENEDVVLRILANSEPPPLDEMGLSPRNLKELDALVRQPYGLILCVGPTGSGKTTTLHAMLASINEINRKIWTAEDPVEITQPGLRQVQVHPQIGFTFAAAMRSFLRADPDVIMVGEMRDEETAHTGVEASLTGHLVFSTLHTNSAPETVTRLVDMGLEPFSFSDALLGVLAQRLARRLCTSCREQYIASAAELAEFCRYLGRDEVDDLIGGGVLTLWHASGCSECDNTGYRGRVALHELLVNNDEIRGAIQQQSNTANIRELSIAGGMTTLLQDGVTKVIEGLTDLKQVLAVCSR
jgi:type II secretory ATPase GspE/PulE/Tfp pilus assembly ATPase PilB-like protein